VVSPQGDNHLQIENEFKIYLSLDNPHNVNHKYSYLYKPDKEQFTNRGIKRTHAYTSCVTIEEIKKKRLEFWETRVEGCPNTWTALRHSCECYEIDDNALAVLKAAGVKCIDKTIQMCYDDNMYKYDIPIFVINDPLEYKINDVSKKPFENKNIKIKIRQGGKDVEFNVNTADNVGE